MTATGVGVDAAAEVRPVWPAPPAVEPFAARPVLAMAAVSTVVLVALSSRYGYHRDEFYYLWGGEHPAWGYVDHPPLVPLVAHLADVVGGHTLVALRAVPALIAGWLVVAGALVARELGGTRRAQILAAFAVLCVPAARGPEALYGTTAADAAVWAVLFVLFVRLLRTERLRLWLWIGLATGIGLETKWSVLILAAGLVVGLLVTPGRRLLWSPYALAGGLLALALWAPNLVWNATHDWAFLEFQRNVARQNGDLDDRLLFFPLLLLIAGVAPIVVWLPGWRALFAGRRFRAVAVGAAVIAVAVFVAAGKPYYVAPVELPLLAAGAVVVDGAGARRRRVTIWILAVTGLLTVPLTIPLLPASALNAVTPIDPELAEMVGWPELAATTRRAFDALPADEQAHTVILTDNYGTADAISRYEPDLPVRSSQNSHWLDGPPPASATTVLAVGLRPSALDFCGSTEAVATIANPFGVDNKEAGRPLTVCRQLREPWPVLWARLKSFS